MATGSIHLPPGAAVFPDTTASNLPPAIQRVKSSGTAPAPYFFQLAYDASTDEWATWQFRMPADYASAPVAKVQFKMLSATSGNVVWDFRMAAVTPADAVDLDSAKAFASANTATTAVAATAGYLTESSITVSNADSVAAGDLVVVRLARNGSSGSDTASADAEMVGLTLLYTTV